MTVFTKSWVINLCKKVWSFIIRRSELSFFFLYVTEDNKAVFIDIYDKRDGW